jgi:hypothetical protein
MFPSHIAPSILLTTPLTGLFKVGVRLGINVKSSIAQQKTGKFHGLEKSSRFLTCAFAGSALRTSSIPCLHLYAIKIPRIEFAYCCHSLFSVKSFMCSHSPKLDECLKQLVAVIERKKSCWNIGHVVTCPD